MAINLPTLRPDYWDTFDLSDADLDFLYNYLLEIETPQTAQELSRAIVEERIRTEKIALESMQQAGGTLYRPKDKYEMGQTLVFPAVDWNKAIVTGVRPGNNPEVPSFDVINVQFEDGATRQYAAGLDEHVLNQPVRIKSGDPMMETDHVIKTYGARLSQTLNQKLKIQSGPGTHRRALVPACAAARCKHRPSQPGRGRARHRKWWPADHPVVARPGGTAHGCQSEAD